MHRISVLITLCVVCLGCMKQSEPVAGKPEAKITGETECAAGDLVWLSSMESVGRGKAWEIHPPWAKARMHQVPDGLVFASSKPGEYTFYLSVAEGNEVSMTSHVLKNGAGPEPPGPDPPGPDPPGPDPPGPEPPAPDDWIGRIEYNTYLLAKKHVPEGKRYEQAQVLIKAIGSVCAQIAAGIYENTEQARVAMRKTTNEAMGDNAEDWKKFSEELAIGLKKYADEGKIKELSDYKKAWEAVEKGLKKIERPASTSIW